MRVVFFVLLFIFEIAAMPGGMENSEAESEFTANHFGAQGLETYRYYYLPPYQTLVQQQAQLHFSRLVPSVYSYGVMEAPQPVYPYYGAHYYPGLYPFNLVPESIAFQVNPGMLQRFQPSPSQRSAPQILKSIPVSAVPTIAPQMDLALAYAKEVPSSLMFSEGSAAPQENELTTVTSLPTSTYEDSRDVIDPMPDKLAPVEETPKYKTEAELHIEKHGMNYIRQNKYFPIKGFVTQDLIVRASQKNALSLRKLNIKGLGYSFLKFLPTRLSKIPLPKEIGEKLIEQTFSFKNAFNQNRFLEDHSFEAYCPLVAQVAALLLNINNIYQTERFPLDELSKIARLINSLCHASKKKGGSQLANFKTYVESDAFKTYLDKTYGPANVHREKAILLNFCHEFASMEQGMSSEKFAKSSQ